jgi:hypothetical protein
MKPLLEYMGHYSTQLPIDQKGDEAADLTFFKLKLRNNPNPMEFLTLVKKYTSGRNLLDGEEHNYLELGALFGDRSQALTVMGMGHLLGLWHLQRQQML